MNHYLLRHLSDHALALELDASAANSRRAVADVIARIAEYDRRRLYLGAGYPSMFRYCVDRLHMSEDVAVQRIRIGRKALRFPALFEAIAQGRLSPTCAVLLGPHLNDQNVGELLAAATHAPIRDVRRLLAERFGRVHVVPPLFEAAAPSAEPPAAGSSAPLLLAAAPAPSEASVSKRMPVALPEPACEQAPGPVATPTPRAEPLAPAAPPRRARIQAVGPGAFELVAILGRETHDQLVASRELLGHAVPAGDLATVLERAIALQFAHLRKRRCADTERPRAPQAEPSEDPHHVPAAVQRAVWERDGGSCAFRAEDGHRCGSRERIELDHIVPVAHGGASTADNLRLVCRAHNRHLAELAFGRDKILASIEAARRLRVEKQRERTPVPA